MPRPSRHPPPPRIPRPLPRPNIFGPSHDERRPRGLHPVLWVVIAIAAVVIVATAYLPGDMLVRAIMVTLLLFHIAGAFLLAAQERERRLTAQRRKAGRCLVCGYDLRANPDQCPECGAGGRVE